MLPKQRVIYDYRLWYINKKRLPDPFGLTAPVVKYAYLAIGSVCR